MPLVEQSEIPIHGASASSLSKHAGDFHSLDTFLQVLSVNWGKARYNIPGTHSM